MLVLSFDQVLPTHAPLAGGKAIALAALLREGLLVPEGLVITTTAYQEYVSTTGIRNRIGRELRWRPVDRMRWEELWDASLRIRSAFAGEAAPAALWQPLRQALETRFGGTPVAVRSSAPGEDASGQSFAGLHESYLNIRGAESILEHVRLVWASLWSDAALLYRKELGLDTEKSAMAVVVQEMVAGDRSGVAFGRHPVRPECVAIEAVHGLNQGLVDGRVAPDRWTLDRRTGAVVAFDAAARSQQVVAVDGGVALRPLPQPLVERPALLENEVQIVFKTAMRLEEIFQTAQDLEWTFDASRLYVLQSRAITTTESAEGDKRAWYLSLRRSVDNLQELRRSIEEDLIPKMDQEAADWEKLDLKGLSDTALLAEMERRYARYEAWLGRYWEECIPFAHGVRLFGQFYNDAMHPSDPYEFVALLSGSGLLSVKRNEALLRLADAIREQSGLRSAIESGEVSSAHAAFWEQVDALCHTFPLEENPAGPLVADRSTIVPMLLEMAKRPAAGAPATTQREELERRFLAHFENAKRTEASELLDLARASYRLRDDDNIYLGRIARQAEAVRDAAVRRGLQAPVRFSGSLAMRPTGGSQHAAPTQTKAAEGFALRARQLLGQPAGPGLGAGTARLVHGPRDLYAIQAGEVLVCDALDPNMTFVMPLVSGIIECRGGMLVHGAIIAREYGIPCVTGVGDALSMIATGDRVQVDGFLGIVTIN